MSDRNATAGVIAVGDTLAVVSLPVLPQARIARRAAQVAQEGARTETRRDNNPLAAVTALATTRDDLDAWLTHGAVGATAGSTRNRGGA